MALIKILSTSDVHGIIYPYTYARKENIRQGFARLKTLINLIRDQNTILIDNGDVLEGSPLVSYHYRKHKDEACPISLAMADLGYDYINLGNHDFNHGEEALLAHIRNTKAQCLCANVIYKGKPLGPDYVIREIAGKKIALFALTSHYIPHWEDPRNIVNFEFIDAYECAERIVKEIKENENPDYIICIYHGGFERDFQSGKLTENDTGENQGYKMMEKLPDIDIMIAGHQHQLNQGKCFNTVYTQAGANGSRLSCITINSETSEIKSELLRNECSPDQPLMDQFLEEEKAVQEWLDTPLGRTDHDLLIHDERNDRLHKSQLVTFINLVQQEISKADLSATALSDNIPGLPKEITLRDVVSTYTYANTLVVKKISGRILKEYLEKCARFWTIKDDEIAMYKPSEKAEPLYFNYDMVDGIEYTIKVSEPVGNRICELKKDGKEIQDDDEFTICVNSYRAGGSGGFEMIQKAETVCEIQRNIADLLAEYIEENKTISFKETDNIKVIK